MMLGLGAGDTFGAAREYTEPDPTFSQIEVIGGGPFGWRPGQPTGVTKLAIAVLQSLHNRKDFDIEQMRSRIADRSSFRPSGTSIRVRGKGRAKILGAYPAAPPESNDSLARVAGLALLDLPWGIPLFNILDDHGRLTSCSETCLIADRILIAGLRAGLNGGDRQKVMRTMAMTAHLSKWRHSFEASALREWSQVSTTSWVVSTLNAAYWSLANCRSLEEAVIKLAARGQDASAVCAVSAALWGSIGGVEAIPARWLDKIEARDEIISEVDRVVRGRKSLSIK